MRQRTFFALCILILILLPLIPAYARPANQMAGCVTEKDQPYAVRYRFKSLYDQRFQITAIGLDGFDPQLELRTASGRLVACNGDHANAETFAVTLPTVVALPNDKSAQITHRFYADEQFRREVMDFEVSVTGRGGQSGHFVLIFEGSYIFDGRDVDSVEFSPTPAQIAAQVPLTMYAVDAGQEGFLLQPQLDYRFGTAYFLTCRPNYALNPDRCPAGTPNLTGYSLTLGERELPLKSTDVMLSYVFSDLENAQYSAEVSAFEASSYGPYIWVIQSAVVYQAG